MGLYLPLMELNSRTSSRNFNNFIWHAVFASIAINFMDFDTVLPAMIVQSGGTAWHVGLLTAIMVGGAKLVQLPLAPFLFFARSKKNYLILGITIRFIALFSISAIFYFSGWFMDWAILFLIFLFISFFSFSEAFASLSYTDILGKSVLQEKRKHFLSLKQVITSLLIFASSFMVKYLLQTRGFPSNYSMLFLIAGSALAIASIGFWRLKEIKFPINAASTSLRSFIPLFRNELKGNRVLVAYLVIINTLGIGMGVLPFMILYAKTQMGIGSAQVGNFVILKTLGLVLSGLLLYRFASKIGYKTLLYISVGVGAAMPLFGIFASGSVWLYSLVFLLGGVFISFFNVSRTGVLLEISTNTNRVLYAGIAGFGSILVTVFPLLAGWVIDSLGFSVFFTMISITILISLGFIYRLNCETPFIPGTVKKEEP